MGTYDPVQAVSDNERNSGNILNAMIQFPTDYCFNVLGKTQGDDSMKQKYIQDVTSIVEKVSGYGSEHFDIRVIDRGIRFTKISITVKVDSTSVINSIYDELGRIDMTVMKY
jgi:putative lipoic acid-binding regulatory protein